MVFFTNDFISLIEENEKVYITTFQTGFSLKDFDSLIREYPRVKLTNFALLKNALSKITDQKVEIGRWLPNVEIEISNDKMSASIIIHETIESLRQNKENLITQIRELLSENNIIYGLKEIDLSKIMPGKASLIAQGTLPVQGEDAVVKYLELPERKPVIREDGKADYFEMNFIFEIQEGDWLGEKIPPQPGTDGKNIFGETIPAPHGKEIPLKYDKKSAMEIKEEGKIVLYATTNGVVEHKQGLISVNRHLPIDGDVGIETGNIKFDGSVTIRGTIMNGYSVVATGDISIESLEGVSGAKEIKSLEGDIYIKGGIFGLGKTEIVSGGSIFVKHVNEANLLAKNDIVIGYYSLGSFIIGDSILVDEKKGKIIGGKVVAKNQIVTAYSGNYLERRTELIIESESKQELSEKIQQNAAKLKEMNSEVIRLTSQANQVTQGKANLTTQQIQSLATLQKEIEKKKESAVELNKEIKYLMRTLQKGVKEEIIIKKEAFPGTYIQIGNKSALLTKSKQGTFKLEMGELNV